MLRRGRTAVIAGALLASGVVATLAIPHPALAAATDVVISEIMFDPLSDLDTDEFLEVRNSGTTPVDISGWCFTGITFCFPAGTSMPAGQYLVVSPNAARTQTLYGITPIGIYTGGLKNSGELIELKNAANTVIHSFSFLDVHPWPVLPDGQGPSLEMISLDGPRGGAWNWAASQAPAGHTAGAVNSVSRSGVPQTINSITESTLRPANGQAVTVTANITGQVGTPVISYRRNMGAFTNLNMTNGGGGNWTATLPAQTAGTLLEYKITTQGVFPHSYPRIDDSWRTIGIWYARTVANDIPVFEWFISEADFTSMTTTFRFDETGVTFESAMVFDNEVITGARVRVRGKQSRNDPKMSFKWELPQNHNLTTAGRLIEPIDEFAMQSDQSDRSYARSMLAFRVYATGGLARPQRFPMRVERNGQFQGLYGMMDTYDKTWRERFGYETGGRFYEAESSVWDLTRRIDRRWDQKSGPEDVGLANIAGLSDAMVNLTGAELEAYVRANFDIPQIINYAALTSINNHIDSATKNFYIWRADATGRFSIVPWDLDHTWGNGCTCGVASTFVTPAEPGDRVNRMLKAVLDVPEFKQMYFRRLRTLSDQIFVPGQLENWYDESLIGTGPTAVLDKAKWALGSAPNFDRNLVFGAMATRRNTIYGDARLPAAQAAAPTVLISEIHTSVGGGTAQFIELYNPSTTVAVDVSGWKVAGAATATLQPGSVIAPGKTIVVVSNDLAFKAALGSAPFVAGRYTGFLPAAGTLNIARIDNSIADTVVYGGAGWPTPAAGQSIQVINLAAGNDSGTNWRAATPTPGATSTPVATTLVCTKTVNGANAVLTFSGLRGSSWEQIRQTPNTWIATVTGLPSYMVPGGAAQTYFVRVRGTGFAQPSQDIPCA
jgi:CotH kinase protein/Lamin Tail Domain